MRIAFYAPLKSPDHPVVSGDREMARLLIRALELAGHTVEIASELRAYLREPDPDAWQALRMAAAGEVERLARQWADTGPPDLWFTYHPYYKSPDLIGPPLASRFSLPFVTAEASLSSRRNIGAWAQAQTTVADAVSRAAVNLCLTRRDHDGLAGLVPEARLAMLAPFIDTAGQSSRKGHSLVSTPVRLVTVAMMRPGDKLDSYRMLAAALTLIEQRSGQSLDGGTPTPNPSPQGGGVRGGGPLQTTVVHNSWQLAIAGDGPAEAEVKALFQHVRRDRVTFLGRLDRQGVASLLANSDLSVWPGCGEAFGLAYLEAQAAGLPVVAQETAGVPEVVRRGETGLLTPAGDVRAYAEAIARLVGDPTERARLGDNARRHVAEKHSLAAAARRLTQLLPTRTAA